METMIIYVLLDPRSDEIRYLGKTKNVKIRMYGHANEKGKLGHKFKWVQKLKKLGLKPKIEVWDIVPKKEDDFWECHYISLLKSWGIRLTNFTDGGGNPPIVRRYGSDNVFVNNENVREKILAMNKSRKGKTLTELYGEEKANELLKLKSERFSGKNNPMFGKKQKQETKDKISTKNKGRYIGKFVSNATKEKMSLAQKGKPKTDAHKKKLRELALNRPPMSDETKSKIAKTQTGKSLKGEIHQLSVDKKELIKSWKGYWEIKKVYGNKSCNISSCVNGKLNTAYGYFWTRELQSEFV